jgi:molecular chaperone DnaK (HSP70)
MWLGIDLGTSNSCVYKVDTEGNGDVVPSATGESLTPSVVCVGPSEILCGELALNGDAASTFFGFKRTIGRVYNDKAMWKGAVDWPFHITRPANPDEAGGTYCAMLGGELVEMTSNDLYTHLVRHMLKDVDVRAAKGVTVTVPAHFNTMQRDATLAALAQAGVAGCSVLNEPTAAAVAYLHDKPQLCGGVLVVDVGGGTIDCTLLRCESDRTCTVVASNGTSEVGGEVVTDKLVHKMIAKTKTCKDDKAAISKLRSNVERAKKALSVVMSVQVADTEVTLVRADVEACVAGMLSTLCDLCARVCTAEPPDVVVLCGGGTLMPSVRTKLLDMYPSARMSTELNVMTAVARGAALHARRLSNTTAPTSSSSTVVVNDILTAAVGVRVEADTTHVLLSAGSKLPCKAKASYKMKNPKQASVVLVVVQGNNHEASLNATLGRFTLPPGRCTVELSVDEDGSLTVSATRTKTRERLLLQKVPLWQ